MYAKHQAKDLRERLVSVPLLNNTVCPITETSAHGAFVTLAREALPRAKLNHLLGITASTRDSMVYLAKEYIVVLRKKSAPGIGVTSAK